MAIKAKIIIKRGNKTLFIGEVKSLPQKYETYHADKDRMEDLFNIERFINTQGAYRCHIECDDGE